MSNDNQWLDDIAWDERGLVPVIAQDRDSRQVLMMAWMNREALMQTVATGRAVYWSRSRNRLWRKGEQSGNEQIVHEVRLDCDRDALLLSVEQKGGIACHTGRAHCFFNRLDSGRWETVDAVIRDPAEMYHGSNED